MEEKQLDTSYFLKMFLSSCRCFTANVWYIAKEVCKEKMETPGKYARDTAVRLLANWNIDKVDNAFKTLELNLQRS